MSADSAALIGDAAHAIVPFHGQGMNCCFEDCVEFDACIGALLVLGVRVRRVLRELANPTPMRLRAMALENYLEMRERVADPHSGCSSHSRWSSSGASRSASYRATPW